jgi:hypothetical protein
MRELATPDTTKAPRLQGFLRMGGTGLEPDPPACRAGASVRTRSRECAYTVPLSRITASSERLSEPERTPVLATLATPNARRRACHRDGRACEDEPDESISTTSRSRLARQTSGAIPYGWNLHVFHAAYHVARGFGVAGRDPRILRFSQRSNRHAQRGMRLGAVAGREWYAVVTEPCAALWFPAASNARRMIILAPRPAYDRVVA